MSISTQIVSVKHTIKNSNINKIYSKCVSWIKDNAKIIKTNNPYNIIARHEKLSGTWGYVSILDWPKIINIDLSQKLNDVEIIINIGTNDKSVIDNIENRSQIWPIIAGKILLHCGINKNELNKDYFFPKKYYTNKMRRVEIVLLFSLIALTIILYTYIASHISLIIFFISSIMWTLISIYNIKELRKIRYEIKNVYS